MERQDLRFTDTNMSLRGGLADEAIPSERSEIQRDRHVLQTRDDIAY